MQFAKSKAKFTDLFNRGVVMQNYAGVLEMLLRLRQICDHPTLCGMAMDEIPSNQENSPHGIEKNSRDIEEQICGICLDQVENPLMSSCCKQHFCTECIQVLILSLQDHTGALLTCPSCSQNFTEDQLRPVQSRNTTVKITPQKLRISSKINVLIHELRNVKHEKTVVFSQWTSMLDIVEDAFRSYGWGSDYVRLDGSMSLVERDRVLTTFKTRPNVRIIIISLKAGGVGLNLTHANNVYLIDPWWNPAVEEQAIDRVHRIGQTKQVVVRRLIMKNSVEQQILKLHQVKMQLIQRALGDERNITQPCENFKLGLEDLRQLFSEEYSL